MAKITVELGRLETHVVKSLQFSIMGLITREIPGHPCSITADFDDPFAIPAFDFGAMREVDDRNGDPVASDPYAELKARIRDTLDKLRAAMSAPRFDYGRQLEGGDCGDPNCPFCAAPAGPFTVEWPVFGQYDGARQVPTRADNKAGTIDKDGNAVSNEPGIAYASGTIVILADELKRAMRFGWGPDGEPWESRGQMLVKVQR